MIRAFVLPRRGSAPSLVLRLSFVAGLVVGCKDTVIGTDGTGVTGVVFVNGVPTAGVAVLVTAYGGATFTATTDANGVYRYELSGTIGEIGEVQVVVLPPPGTVCANRSVLLTPVQGQFATVHFDCTSVTMTGGWLHISPGVSVECKLVVAGSAPLGTTYVLEVTGPTEGGVSGVVAGQPPLTGILGAGGTARIQVQINRLGTYRNRITLMVPDGIVTTAVLNVTVTAAQGVCP